MRRAATMVLTMLALSACVPAESDGVEADLGPIEDMLGDVAETVWPGNVTDIGRHVRMVNGFVDGEPTAYWFASFASRIPADVFWFCREGDARCPLDSRGTIDRGRTLGRPVFKRIPGDAGFSPFWRMWEVRVPDSYQPDDIKSVAGIEQASRDGRVRVQPVVFDHGGDIGHDMAIMHCLLVLTGTELQRNGEPTIDDPSVPSMYIPPQLGWHKQHRVEFYDFTASEGVFAPDPASESVALMRFGDIFVMFRDCQAGSKSVTCSNTSSPMSAVSERGIEADLTGDGDKADNNNIISGFPRRNNADPRDRAYSPLWRVMQVRIPPEHDGELALIDSTGDQNDTVLKSPQDIRDYAAAGLLDEPHTLSEGNAGDMIVGNDATLFFNCPSQVPAP